ncbi:MFS transporter [Gilvimarinus sp. DA14]|uniref:CynX/NimT family MFS transporter n=1 Tax=Gilvimarinus sp. DA14 TaxID=2956798 RepID=UPI0020B7EE06|nr:CynX/NimT family MFS transporter [Gilvimarinus sp. DA14]UTF60291.1 CynX/NimT family MFS transporter [Gilvimarinus sp. DA14]
MATTSPTLVRHSLLTLLGVLLVALNLRPALTSVSPVLRSIGEALALSPAGLGLLTTVPVACLGLSAPLAPMAARRIGMERTVLVAVILLAVALAIRPYSGTVGLFAGTAFAGGCIGVMGVLLPGIVKRDFPKHTSLMTGLYTAVMCLGAALAAGATEPLRIAMNESWSPALAFWLLPAAIAALAWWRQLGEQHKPATRKQPTASLLKDPLAWQVTLYMGLQSSLAYAVFGWLPSILQDRGLSAVEAGLALSASILSQIVTAIAAPWLASRMRDERFMVVVVMSLTLLGLGGCIYAPVETLWLWAVILGLGQGGTFAMGLTLLALRARTPIIAARLSGMAQGVGYTLAAFGPLLTGILHDIFHGWKVTGVFLGAIGAVAIAAGLGAGRRRYVLESQASHSSE